MTHSSSNDFPVNSLAKVSNLPVGSFAKANNLPVGSFAKANNLPVGSFAKANKIVLNPIELAAFGAELDALRAETVATLGAADANHVRKMLSRARLSASAGRSLLMFGFDPFSWVIGVIALAKAKILENMEVGHNVLHGQYDWMNDPAFNSQTYDWDIACHPQNWRQTHNIEHHSHTNVLGKDDDYGYGLLRLSPDQRWYKFHLLQPLWCALLMLLFQWGVAIQDMKLGRYFKGKMSLSELKERAAPFLQKSARQLFKDYVLFPVLAFFNWPRVLLGNLAANLIRNVWTNVIIFCGHFTEHAHVYTKAEVENETRGAWYLRQMQGSSNLVGSRYFYLMTGHLSHQIEHHLFPDIPAPRYIEMAPKVKAICLKYGIHYNAAGFFQQYFGVMKRVFKFAWPTGAKRSAAQLQG
jgi:NADPH-dependent stearoyl-CoA 9-desaturase